MGKFNSTLTRVVPVFDALFVRDASGESWLPALLRLPRHGASSECAGLGADFRLLEHRWGEDEKALAPPVSLLSWLIRNVTLPDGSALAGDPETIELRASLLRRDPKTAWLALQKLREEPASRAWFVFEGPTSPDVFLATSGALVVIEGKRTEAGPTTSTTWMPVRHQMLRHIDAAWEIRGNRSVYGFFIVEGDERDDGTIPVQWIEAAAATVSTETVAGSLPHRSPKERDGIVAAFKGVTIWQAVCRSFDIGAEVLLEYAPEIR